MSINKTYVTEVDLSSDVNGNTVISNINGSSSQLTATTFLSGPAGPTGATGATGSVGATGSTGAAGTNGNSVLNGSGVPSSGLGNNGDFYIDNTAHSIYGPKTAGAWGSATNIVGPTGATGATGAAGTTGSTGATGAAGTAGTVWYSGSGVPSAGTGVNGDYYLRTSTGDVYTKSAGAWGSPIASLLGPTGATGATGSAGANGSNGTVWYTGAGAPSTLHNNGDMYLNTSNGDVYQQAAGAWGSPIENLTGPAGSGSGDMILASVQTVTGAKTFNDGKLVLAGSSSGTTVLKATAAASGTITLPAATDTVMIQGAPVMTAVPTGAGVASVATASTAAVRDANGNMAAVNMFEGFTTTVTAAGTTTLTIASTDVQVFTGSSTQTVKLPTTSVPTGATYTIINQSTGAVTVQSSASNTITILAAGTNAIFTSVVATPTTAANWNANYNGTVVASGKSLTISNTLTIVGTDGTTMTFPGTSATIARTDAAQTFTGVQTLSSSPVLSTGTVTVSGNTVTLPATADTVVARATTDTLTNKRVTKRITSITSSATPTFNTDTCDQLNITALAANITSMTSSMTGTPQDADELWVRIKGAASQTIAWGTGFASSGVATLLAATVAGKTHKLKLEYDGVLAKWVCMAVDAVGY